MLFITHDLPEALRLGDRIAIMRDGAIVQLGTPEELVGSPADDYVANFVRDIPRSHVLTLRWIMRDADPARIPPTAPKLDVTTTVREAVPALAASEKPVCAVENGKVVGIVDRDAVLQAIAGEEATDVASVAAETAAPRAGHRPSALVAREPRPGRGDRGADVRRLPGLGTRVSVAGQTRLELAVRAARRLPDLAPDRARPGGPVVRLHDLRGLQLVRSNTSSTWFDRAAALADVGRDDHRGRR